jgi:hypothetical protein
MACPRCGGTLLLEYGRKGRRGKGRAATTLFALWRCRPCKRVVAHRRIR